MTGCIEISGLILCILGIIIMGISAWKLWDTRNTFDTTPFEFLAVAGIVVGLVCFLFGFIAICPPIPCVVIV